MNEWTLEELTRRVAIALEAGGYEGAPNGRVREIPDARGIRYYTTLGLLDRPAAFRGRTALYGRRHLMQIVAIKRMQSEGRPLAEIQQVLAGIGEAALGRMARVPEAATGEVALPEKKEPEEKPRGRRSESFWGAAPAEPAAPKEVEAQAFPALPPGEGTGLVGVDVGGGVVLLVGAVRPLSAGDVEAIRAASAPVLKVLSTRGLVTDRGIHERKKP